MSDIENNIDGVNINEPVSELHRWARMYGGKGWPVFPCISNEQGKTLSAKEWKKPACPHGHHEATADLAQIDAWWRENPNANIGFDLHKIGLAAIDEEHDAGDWSQGRPLPKTRTVISPHEGKHYHYKGALPSTVAQLAPRVDTRGNSTGYVLLPPSVVDGKPYRWGTTGKAAPLPQWIADALPVIKRRRPETNGHDHEDDSEANVGRAIKHLQGLPELQERKSGGKGGADYGTYKVACQLRDIGLSPRKAHEVLLEHLKITPRGKRLSAFLERKIANAWEYATGTAGAHAGQTGSQVFGDHPDTKEAPRGVIRVYDEAAQDRLPDVKWRIKGILPDSGPSSIVSPPKSGKTIFATDIGLSIAANRPAFGKLEVVQPGPVFYLTNEGFKAIARRRRPAWRIKRGIPDDEVIPFYLIDNVPQAEDPNATEVYSRVIDAELKKTGRQPALIEIDTLSKSLGGLNEKDADAANLFDMNVAQVLERRFGCGTLTVAHTGKDVERGIRGNNAFEGNFENLLWLASDKARRVMKLTATMKDADDDWAHHLRSTHIAVPGTEGGAYVVHWITPEEYERVTSGGEALYFAAIKAAFAYSAAGLPITRHRYPQAQRENVTNDIERETNKRHKWSEIIAALELAVAAGELIYQAGKDKGVSGYWPAPAKAPM